MGTNVAASVRRPLPISLRSWIVDTDGTRYAGGLPGEAYNRLPTLSFSFIDGQSLEICRFPTFFPV
jgi:hypothetical protein